MRNQEIETRFSFVNVTSRDLVLRVTQGADGATKKPIFSNITVAGKSVPIFEAKDGQPATYEIPVPASDSSAITFTSNRRGDLPLILELPQSVSVRSGAEVQVVSHVQGRIGLLVPGSSECSFCQDWYEEARPLDRVVKISKPLLPGESIILFVGRGRPALSGKALFDPPPASEQPRPNRTVSRMPPAPR